MNTQGSTSLDIPTLQKLVDHFEYLRDTCQRFKDGPAIYTGWDVWEQAADMLRREISGDECDCLKFQTAEREGRPTWIEDPMENPGGSTRDAWRAGFQAGRECFEENHYCDPDDA